ncbi:hypothetical protein EDB81DRAFT_360933 [Dactylonectria macrodidyma]|uniref:Secreted protein n=1 Tax=Dactylonectria macrodidyma TaxID=307937 RepID=A0A9P9D349_9HYPO|nr:hypothetical protein EDB81DRAFT_360933 [Dactylonectria macrodidyma]
MDTCVLSFIILLELTAPGHSQNETVKTIIVDDSQRRSVRYISIPPKKTLDQIKTFRPQLHKRCSRTFAASHHNTCKCLTCLSSIS